ncbi:hypothetical protein GTA08_BOTSDO04620 [Neofusicoccum parvum]|nr:hypothetical protein GTA08_BOTSDO04620 [Neofusicoccum parvum]
MLSLMVAVHDGTAERAAILLSERLSYKMQACIWAKRETGHRTKHAETVAKELKGIERKIAGCRAKLQEAASRPDNAELSLELSRLERQQKETELEAAAEAERVQAAIAKMQHSQIDVVDMLEEVFVGSGLMEQCSLPIRIRYAGSR